MRGQEEPHPRRLVPSPATAGYVRDRFGLGGELTMEVVARGLCGRVWRLGSPGTRYALKELFWDDDQDEREVRRRVAFEDAARAAGVRCPRSLPTVDGGYLCRLPRELGGVYVRVSSWVDGIPVTEPDRAAAWLGRTLAGLHRLRHPAVGPANPKFDSVPAAAAWRALAPVLLARRVPWQARLEGALPAIEKLRELVTPADRDAMVMCHLDLTPANVLVDAAGGFVLIDWELAGPGCPRRELAAALLEWHVADGSPDPAAIARTMAAYRDAGGPARLGGLAAFGGYLASAVNNLYTQAEVATAEEADPEHRELAHARVELALRSLPDRALLERVAELAGRAP